MKRSMDRDTPEPAESGSSKRSLSDEKELLDKTEIAKTQIKNREETETLAKVQVAEATSSMTVPWNYDVTERSGQIQQTFQQCPSHYLQSISINSNTVTNQVGQYIQHGMPSQFLNNFSCIPSQVLMWQGILPVNMHPLFFNPQYPIQSSQFSHSATPTMTPGQSQEHGQFALDNKDAKGVKDGFYLFNLDRDPVSGMGQNTGSSGECVTHFFDGSMTPSDLENNMSQGSSNSGEAVPKEEQADQPQLGSAEANLDPLEDFRLEGYDEKLKKLPRKWEFTKNGNEYRSQRKKNRGNRQPKEFSLMTYNILAQNLLEDHPHLYSEIEHGASRSLEWEKRRRRLIAEIHCHKPDVISLQEVHCDHFTDYIQPRLERMGYAGCYQKRTGDKDDGCATMWKKDKFRLLQSHPVKFCRGGLLDRDNVAIVVALQPLQYNSSKEMTEPGQVEDKVVIANTHLLFNPRRGDIKLAQLMILLAEIDKLANLGHGQRCSSHRHSFSHNTGTSNHYCPVILTGDLNLEPQSELYKFIVSGKITYEDLQVSEMSGQQDRYGRDRFLERNFFSPMYGVTDNCQYHPLLQNGASEYNSILPFSQGSGFQTQSSYSNSWLRSSTSLSPQVPVNTGQLFHYLNFVSAYRHKLERQGKVMEVTTHHNRGKCSVDYIFYSVNHKDVRFHHDEVQLKNIQDGKLVLLARYGLMSAKEIDHMGGIPNDVLPSDHLCLITRFLLR